MSAETTGTCACVCGVFKNYTVRLLLIQHNADDDEVNDGCLLWVIGVAIGAAGLLAMTIAIATAVHFCHRQPSRSFTARRKVRSSLSHFSLLIKECQGSQNSHMSHDE